MLIAMYFNTFKVLEYIAISVWAALMCGQLFSELRKRKEICKVSEYIAICLWAALMYGQLFSVLRKRKDIC